MATYKIDDIEGIGPAYGAKLRDAGVDSVSKLLQRGASRKGREELAAATGLDAALILTWVNMADLFRVSGIGGEYAELLKKSGVDTVKELRNRNPENLLSKMTEVNSAGAKQLVRSLPGLKAVQSWVQHAKELDAVVTH
jgi:predicted flap endonuclease-1-like 5' DNA nuclease